MSEKNKKVIHRNTIELWTAALSLEVVCSRGIKTTCSWFLELLKRNLAELECR